MTRRIAAGILMTGVLVGPAEAQAPEDAFTDLVDEIELLQSLAQVERQAVIQDNLSLTASGADAFWSLYEVYRADVREVQGRLLALVGDYAANYQTMTDARAGRLLRDWLTCQQDLLDVRRRYVRRFEGILPQIKVARFFQIENKLDAISNLESADQIPLIRQRAGD